MIKRGPLHIRLQVIIQNNTVDYQVYIKRRRGQVFYYFKESNTFFFIFTGFIDDQLSSKNSNIVFFFYALDLVETWMKLMYSS
jgi:hypothetical protein